MNSNEVHYVLPETQAVLERIEARPAAERPPRDPSVTDEVVRALFGPGSNAQNANALAKADRQEYQRLKVQARIAGLIV